MLQFLNPKYQFSLTTSKEKYLIDVSARVAIDLSSTYDDVNNILSAQTVFDESLTKYRVNVGTEREDGAVSFEDYREFSKYEDVIKYILSWKEKKE